MIRDRIIDIYRTVGNAWTKDENVLVHLTPIQCATILSMARFALHSTFGEDIDEASKEN